MKKLFLLTVLTFMFGFCAKSQKISASSPTTEEEYNYLTVGYKVQKESGLDMKSGYKFIDLFDNTFSNYHFTGKLLLRTNKNEAAGIMIETTSNVSGRKYYFCIPYNNSTLYQRYLKDLDGWDYNITKAYSYIISSNLTSILFNVAQSSKINEDDVKEVNR